MKKLAVASAVMLVSGVVLAAGTSWHVQSIKYQGKDIISGTFTLPTGFTVHKGDSLTLEVQGAAGTEIAAEVFLLPVTSADQAGSAMSGTLAGKGKPMVQKIGSAGTVSIEWKIPKDAKPGVRQIRLVSPAKDNDPFIQASGDDRSHWVGIFTIAP